ncbi:NAD-dependent epimerase/dehydratase family protein [Prauserella cavernicola]|uniref:NAD-dependent epimerase/dehydratase n=1 Tax=Prauserella cavernicola TaxID=2800127 RepID=A0A934QWY0_9PSEU|nr:NAD-dependent epimerase/dehydratase [Prauserella cavernicola]MBK1787983.1 NAD-dependent epimerase/dehydratase [Prauserella cavernicola]
MSGGTDTRPLVVVLGASGLIGAAVARALARRDIRLRLVARRCPARPLGSDAETRVADLTTGHALADAVADADAVVNLVAHVAGKGSWRISESDPDGVKVNAELARALVTALGGAGSRERPPVLVQASTTVQPGAEESPYVRQKMLAEHVLIEATEAGSVRAVILRLPTVYGHGPSRTVRDRGVVATMIRQALSGGPITMWHDGTVRRDLLYMRDAGEAFAVAVDGADRLAGERWPVGTGVSTPLGDVFRLIATAVSEHTGTPPVPVTRVDRPDGARDADFRSTFVDSSAFRAATGWEHRTQAEEGIRRTVAVLAAEGGHE